DFARSHPGGSLGKRLLLRVEDIMHKDDDIPVVDVTASLSAALLEMSAKGLGMAVVIDAERALAGVFTDGDLRRLIDRNLDLRDMSIRDAMTTGSHTIAADALAADAVRLMEQHAITALPVVDAQRHVVGALNIHDLFRAGVM
ncbi:MAG: CBS domain-containing protein, partial [Gammaproteobacteria bacterium]